MSASNSPEATGLHPTARPAEKRADIQFSKKDTGLRDDVRMLGGMVGDTIVTLTQVHHISGLECSKRFVLHAGNCRRGSG